MKVSRLPLTGCLEIVPPSFKDERGSFTKSFLAPALEPWGIDFDFREEFYSWSQPGVLRGMHFQVPPAAHGKFVQVLAGEILDVLLDLRTASPTFGRALSLPLSAAEPKVLYLPAGIAHGFKVVGNAPALVHYKTDHEYSPEHDKGVRWDSFGFEWPGGGELLSPRDLAHPRLSEFQSPF